jgi:hypothetical protein
MTAVPVVKCRGNLWAAANGFIVIKRETSVQDAIRSYAIFIDGKRHGRIWASRTRRIEVSEGQHSVLLRIMTGSASSNELQIEVLSEQESIVRTTDRSIGSLIKAPLAIPAGMKAQATGQPIKSSVYSPPWIHVIVEEPGKPARRVPLEPN